MYCNSGSSRHLVVLRVGILVTMPYRTSCASDLPRFKEGDKVLVHTKPYSYTPPHGHGHHELWDGQIGTVHHMYEPGKYELIESTSTWYGRGRYFYQVRFTNTTYIAMLSEDEMDHHFCQ